MLLVSAKSIEKNFLTGLCSSVRSSIGSIIKLFFSPTEVDSHWCVTFLVLGLLARDESWLGVEAMRSE